MIIKSLRHKTFLSNYSLNYLYEGLSDQPEQQWLIFQNIQGHQRHEIIDEFNNAASYLTKTPNRKKVYRYHEVLAFSRENSKDLDRAKLQRITNQYLKLRDPKGLSKAICIPHIEAGRHPHMHLLLTSNHIMSKHSSDMMMTHQQYYDLRRNMERYVLREMPELHHSTVFLKEEEIEQLLPAKYRSERRLMQLQKSRTRQNHQKDRVANIVREVLQKSNDIYQFAELLKNTPDIEPYYRGGKLTGVIHQRKKKYRLKTLGIELLQENFRVMQRMAELKKINERERSDERER